MCVCSQVREADNVEAIALLATYTGRTTGDYDCAEGCVVKRVVMK